MKISLVQLNTREGEISSNKQAIVANIHKAKESGSELVIFPQLAIPGYPAQWVLANNALVEQNLAILQEIAQEADGIGVVVGYIDRNPVEEGKRFYNATALIHDKDVQFVSYKTNLISYDYFQEGRWFEPAISLVPAKFNDAKIIIGTLEDFFYTGAVQQPFNVPDEKFSDLKRKKTDVVIIVGAKPYTYEASINLMNTLKQVAAMFKSYVIFTNCSGSNGAVVFEGNSVVINSNGAVIASGPYFEESFINLDTGYGAGDLKGEDLSDLQKLEKCLITAIRTFSDSVAANSVNLYFDGSLPSFVNLLIAEKAVNKDKITCYFNVGDDKKSAVNDLLSSLGIKGVNITKDQFPQAQPNDVFISNTTRSNILSPKAPGFAPHLYAPLKDLPAKVLYSLFQEVLSKEKELQIGVTDYSQSSEETFEGLLTGKTQRNDPKISLTDTNYFIKGPRVYTDPLKAVPEMPLFWKF